MMADNKVHVLTNTRPVKVVAGGILAKHEDRERVLPAESLVLAGEMRPLNELQNTLAGKVAELHAIGDCVKAGRIIDAIWQAFHTVREIEP